MPHLLHKHLPHAFLFGLHVSQMLLPLYLVRLLQTDWPVVCRLVCKAHLLESVAAEELIVLTVCFLTKVLHVGTGWRQKKQKSQDMEAE